MTTATPKSLHEKLVEVAKTIRNIEKGGTNEAQKYDFVREADVVRKVVPALLEHGILFYPSTRNVHLPVPYKTKTGGEGYLTTVESTWIFTDGKEQVVIASAGQGADVAGDKGIYKALTGDKKYAILQALGIATGDDPEVTRPDELEKSTTEADARFDSIVGTAKVIGDPNKKASDDQMNMVFGRARKVGYDLDDDAGANQFKTDVFTWTGKRARAELTNADVSVIVQKLDEVSAVTAASNGTLVG